MNPKICRLCAKEVFKAGLQLFQRKQKKLLLKIKDLTGLLLVERSSLPQWICSDCRKVLNKSHAFRENVLKVQSQFKYEASDENSIKTDAHFQLFIKTETDFENEFEITQSEDGLGESESLNTKKHDLNEEDSPSVDRHFGRSDLSDSDEDDFNESVCITDIKRPRTAAKNYKEVFSDSDNNDDDLNIKSENEYVSKNQKKKVIKTSEDDSDEFVAHITNVCDQCGYIAASSYRLGIHKSRVHDGTRNYVCEQCPKKFFAKGNLKAHMLVHTGERPFECQFCQRRFTNRSTKYQHERIHTNERPNLCNICGKAFRLSRLLKLHMVIHTGERNFKCNICKKDFGRKTHLTTHYRSLTHKQAAERHESTCTIKSVK